MYDKKIIIISFLLFISISLIILVFINLNTKKNKKLDETPLSISSSPILTLNRDDNNIALTSRFNNYLKVDDYLDGISINAFDRFNENLPVTFGNDLNINTLEVRGNLNVYKELSSKASNLDVSNTINVNNFNISDYIKFTENGPYLKSLYTDSDIDGPMLLWGTPTVGSRCVFFDGNWRK